jgi:hypothetical protein
MLRRSLLFLGLFIAFSGGVVELFRATARLGELEAQLRSAMPAPDSRARAATLEARARALQTSCAALQEAIASVRTGANEAQRRLSAQAARVEAAAAGQRPLSPETIVANDPEKLAEYMRFSRGAIDLDSGNSMQHLKLTPEQREKFKDMVVWSQQRILDIQSAAETEKLSPADTNKLLAEEGRERMKKEAEILGPLEQEFRVYGRMQPVRDVAEGVAALSVIDGTAVSVDQIDRLTSVLSKNAGLRSTGWADITSVNWPRVMEQAGQFLTPRQLDFLDQEQQLYRTVIKLSRADSRTKTSP